MHKRAATALAAARRLRRLASDGAGRIASEALTDGVELLFDTPIRVVFADVDLSAKLFEGAPASDLAFSGRTASTSEAGDGERGPGAFCCFRAGVLRRLCAGDPVARFAFLHELGHRQQNHAAAPRFSERTLEDPRLFVTHGRGGRRVEADALTAVTGERAVWRDAHWRQASARGDRARSGPLRSWRSAFGVDRAQEPLSQEGLDAPTPALMLQQEAAANLFAFAFLADLDTLEPQDDLGKWADHYGAPRRAAEAFRKTTADVFPGLRADARTFDTSTGARRGLAG